MTWEAATAIVIVAVIFFLYKASVELDERHWPMKAGFFYGSIVLGWAAINVAIRFAAENTSSVALQTSFETLYWGYNILALLAFAYLIIRFLWWTSFAMVSKIRTAKEENVW